jgi:hypothetical protein
MQDANLDRRENISDFALLAANFDQTLPVDLPPAMCQNPLPRFF